MRVTDKLLRLLALVEQGPKYGRQFIELAPDLFVSGNQAVINGEQQVNVTNIYMLLARAESCGYIAHMQDFLASGGNAEAIKAGRRKYYGITLKGRELLEQQRANLQVKT